MVTIGAYGFDIKKVSEDSARGRSNELKKELNNNPAITS